MSVQTIVTNNAVLALTAALTWGGGDFSGGMAVKRASGSLRSALRVVFLVHLSSLIVLSGVIALRHDPVPGKPFLMWGLIAGACTGASIIAFYMCLARGAMGSSAAISGLLAAAIPTAVSIAMEGSPGTAPLIGFVLAALAIWLIAAAPQAEPSAKSTTVLAIVAGVGFGLYFVALRMASPAGVLWPLALSRCLSMATAIIGLLAFRLHPKKTTNAARAPWLTRTAFVWAFATAVLDTAGNLFYIAATRSGRLDIAAVLASLYPASTILLAAWVLGERPTARQGLGMLVAAAAVILVTR